MYVLPYRRLRRLTMERHCLKMHKEKFTWTKCIICCREHQEEMLADHIRAHNVYLRDVHYMEQKKLEELLSTENHYAAIDPERTRRETKGIQPSILRVG